MIVAYSLLRKPFKDNLFYLEWLLADPAGFISAFRDGPEKLDEYRSKRHLRFPIIETAFSKTTTPRMVNAKYIDEIRYDRKSEYSFAGLWDHANHLITTFSAIRTMPYSFNLIHTDPGDEKHWQFLHTRLPILLFYATDIAELLISPLLPQAERLDRITSTRRMLGHRLWWDSLGHETIDEDTDAADLPRCPDCGEGIIINKETEMRFFRELTNSCQNCGLIFDMNNVIKHPGGSPIHSVPLTT